MWYAYAPGCCVMQIYHPQWFLRFCCCKSWFGNTYVKAMQSKTTSLSLKQKKERKKKELSDSNVALKAAVRAYKHLQSASFNLWPCLFACFQLHSQLSPSCYFCACLQCSWKPNRKWHHIRCSVSGASGWWVERGSRLCFVLIQWLWLRRPRLCGLV